MRAGIQSQTGQIERQAYAAQHQVGRPGGICHEAEAGSEPAYDYTHYYRAAGQAELYRR